ncbi:hypothetical protein Q8F57_018505 [Paraburkholderia terrae]|uniref:hypothetical protein n=1 Tax=Paraburkholderia terrae TaxID=311230 RepID=UPI00296AE81A|nr:hypothetical protein [Paraburkholderia terrae]MDW3655163.1 hypothetical protein [Paraburkholderia terrae]
MSYSFNVTASTKDEPKARVVQEFDAIVAQQSAHAKDKAAAVANLNAVIDLLAEDESQDIRVECYGSLMWFTDENETVGATIHAGAWYVAKT